MNIVKRIKAKLIRPEAALKSLHPELKKLATALEQIEGDAERDPLAAIVSFFSVTSPWHDRGLADVIRRFEGANDGQYDATIESLKILDGQFARAGRSEYGWNRTKTGEPVTADAVFLGNVNGMPTKPVSYWQKTASPNEPADTWFGRNKNLYGAVSSQARYFIGNHAPIMVERVRRLIAA